MWYNKLIQDSVYYKSDIKVEKGTRGSKTATSILANPKTKGSKVESKACELIHEHLYLYLQYICSPKA